MVEETPSPCLSAYQREELLDDALKIARLFKLDNLATIEFIIDTEGNRYFTEIKPRLQIEHSLTEMVTRFDLVKAQLIASAERKIDVSQEKIQPHGYAIQCRITAEDPWVGLLPYPGKLKRVNFPGGPDVRVDTYISSGCEIPVEYDPLIAKLIVWGESRQACLSRIQTALEEFRLSGTPSNLSILQRIVNRPSFVDGKYDTSYRIRPYAQEYGKIEPLYAIHADQDDHDTHIRDLAIAAAIHYFRRSQLSTPTTPERFTTGWHRSSRRFGN
jgi:acetyl/propionyl-CoA carboxylase alpha subunit